MAEETQRLLAPLDDEDADQPTIGSSLLTRLAAITEDTPSTLSRILLSICLVLLLLLSIFVGLFAGLKHRLSEDHEKPPLTTTVPETTTLTITSSPVASTSYITITATTTLTYTPPLPSVPPYQKPCTSATCIILSGSILDSLNAEQDPCENFYEFANGGWLDKHPVPIGETSTSVFQQALQENKKILDRVLRSTRPTSPSDRESWTKIHDYFQSCMDLDSANAAGLEPLLQVTRTLRQLYNRDTTSQEGMMPDVDSDKAVKDNLTAVLAYLHSLGVDALFSPTIRPDIGLASTETPAPNSLWFGLPELGLPSKKHYDKHQLSQEYTSLVAQLLHSVDEMENELSFKAWPPWPWPPEKPPTKENKTQRAERLSEGVFQFEKDLATFIASRPSVPDPHEDYHPLPLSILQSTLPSVQLTAYVSSFAPRTFPNRVIVTYPPFFQNLSTLLLKTSSEVIESYLVIRAVLVLAPDLGEKTEIWRLVNDFRTRYGSIGKKSRHDFCITSTVSALDFAVGRFFVREAITDRALQRSRQTVADILSAFKSSFPRVQWMDELSSEYAIDKARALRVKVGYPLGSPNCSNPSSVAAFYSPMQANRSDYFSSTLSARANLLSKSWRGLGRSNDQKAWTTSPINLKPRYRQSTNEITLPAGMLHPPLFSEDWPGYLMYGGFGASAARELTHAFDIVGRLYNAAGQLRDWWTSHSAKAYDNLQRCILDQDIDYSRTIGNGDKIWITESLNSADIIATSGISLAYRAWNAQYNRSLHLGREFLLPGVNLTREQLFFVSFAQTLAENEASMELQSSTPNQRLTVKRRIEGTLRNMPEFSLAFNCPAGAKLNLPITKRCSIW